jgi:ribosomal protein S18 acetylase RimI-like enzyme
MALGANLRIEPLGPSHDRAVFSCAEPALDNYIRHQASQDVRNRVTNVFVAVESFAPIPAPILGYYTLSSTSFSKADLPADIAKSLPHYPVPAAILGRLAVRSASQGQRLGTYLLFDAFARVIHVSQTMMAIHALIVDAKNHAAAAWYERYGFQRFPNIPLRLFISTATLVKANTPSSIP